MQASDPSCPQWSSTGGPSAGARAREPDTSRGGRPIPWRPMENLAVYGCLLGFSAIPGSRHLAVYGEMARSAHVIGLRRASGPQAPSFGGADDPICGISAVRPVRGTWAVTITVRPGFGGDPHVHCASRSPREPDGICAATDLAAYGRVGGLWAQAARFGGLWASWRPMENAGVFARFGAVRGPNPP